MSCTYFKPLLYFIVVGCYRLELSIQRSVLAWNSASCQVLTWHWRPWFGVLASCRWPGSTMTMWGVCCLHQLWRATASRISSVPSSNQVYYQKEDMLDGSKDDLCAPGVLGLFVNMPCTWAARKATMTVAPLINATGPFETSTGTTARMKRATWLRGWCKSLQIYLTSPDGQPWGSAVNTIGAGGVWFFPRGWPHAFVCLSEEGCNHVLTFNGPQAVAVNDHMIAETYTQMPDEIASYSMGMSQGEWAQAKPKAAAFTARFFAEVIPEKFHWLEETTSLPAAANRSDVEVEDINPIQIWASTSRSTTSAKLSFPLPPGCLNKALSSNRAASVTWFGSPMLQPSWTVISGLVNAGTQGGISGGFDAGPSSTLYTGELGDHGLLSSSFYFPIRGYWIQEATGTEPAQVIVVFEVGKWKALEAKEGFSCQNPLGRSLGLWIYDGKHHLSANAACVATGPRTASPSCRSPCGLRTLSCDNTWFLIPEFPVGRCRSSRRAEGFCCVFFFFVLKSSVIPCDIMCLQPESHKGSIKAGGVHCSFSFKML